MAESTTINRNKEMIRRLYEEAWNERDLSVAEEIHADEWVHHNPSNPVDIEGFEGWKQHFEMATDAFPDVEFILHDIVAEEDAVVAFWTFTGTHEHEFAGIPATDERIEVQGFNLHHVDEGKIIEEWAVRDSLGLLEQLGVAPTDESSS